MKNEVDQLKESGQRVEQLFDNPLALLNFKLTHGILEKEDIAFIFNISIKNVERMMADGSLHFHYVGNKPRFYLNEVVGDFRNDSLDIEARRNSHDKKKNQQGWNGPVSSEVGDTGPTSLQEIRLASGRDRVGKRNAFQAG